MESAVGSQKGGGEKQKKEVILILITDAIIDENAVMIEFWDAFFADTTVFWAGGFEDMAGVARMARVEDGEVVGV